MASNNSTIKLIKSGLKQEHTLAVKHYIDDYTKSSSGEFDQPLSDFRIRFDYFADNVSKKFTSIVSITSKLQEEKFDAVAILPLTPGCNTIADKKSSVANHRILEVHMEHSRLPFHQRATVSVSISSTRTSSNTMADHTTTNDIYNRKVKFLNDFYKSRDSTGDVSIVTACNQELRVHKSVLGLRSSFFKTVFEVDLKERQESKVKIDKFAADLVVGLIEFMYTGWTACVGTNPEGLLEMAHMYQVEDLVKACWDSLMKTLDVKTVFKLLRLSGKFDDDGSYKKQVGRFLSRNFEVICKTEEFAAVVKEDTDLFVEICGLDV